MTLYRGVAKINEGFDNALKGNAVPRGGHSDPELHNHGDTGSEFTSWSYSRKIAEAWGRVGGQGGVVMEKDFDKSEIVKSIDGHNEAEALIRGPVTGAKTTIIQGELGTPRIEPGPIAQPAIRGVGGLGTLFMFESIFSIFVDAYLAAKDPCYNNPSLCT